MERLKAFVLCNSLHGRLADWCVRGNEEEEERTESTESAPTGPGQAPGPVKREEKALNKSENDLRPSVKRSCYGVVTQTGLRITEKFLLFKFIKSCFDRSIQGMSASG